MTARRCTPLHDSHEYCVRQQICLSYRDGLDLEASIRNITAERQSSRSLEALGSKGRSANHQTRLLPAMFLDMMLVRDLSV